MAANVERSSVPFRAVCGKCGAVRVDKQLGLENTIDEYVSQLVAVFREVKRCLHPTGCLFLNLSDSYRDKQLCGVPWKVAFALQEDGWILRQEITWAKVAPMPESVRDRFTSATEHIFLLAKNERYYFDNEAVKESATSTSRSGNGYAWPARLTFLNKNGVPGGQAKGWDNVGGTRNMRNFWLLGPEPFSGAHFAVMPTEIVKRCVLAGSSERGVCSACRNPWVRVTETDSVGEVKYYEGKHSANDMTSASARMNANGRARRNQGGNHDNPFPSARTLGWQPSCACHAPTTPAVIFDPFGGSGTTALVASRLGRNAVVMDLSQQYCQLAKHRITDDAPLFVGLSSQVVAQVSCDTTDNSQLGLFADSPLQLNEIPEKGEGDGRAD